MTINSNETAVIFKSHLGHPVSAGKQWASNTKVERNTILYGSLKQQSIKLYSCNRFIWYT